MNHPKGLIVGPAVCKGCAMPVWWARSTTRLDGVEVPGLANWRDSTGRVHRCGPIGVVR